VQPSIAAVNRWESELVAHIERFKRYPSAARAQGTQAQVRVAFTMDREGSVQASRVRAGARGGFTNVMGLLSSFRRGPKAAAHALV